MRAEGKVQIAEARGDKRESDSVPTGRILVARTPIHVTEHNLAAYVHLPGNIGQGGVVELALAKLEQGALRPVTPARFRDKRGDIMPPLPYHRGVGIVEARLALVGFAHVVSLPSGL